MTAAPAQPIALQRLDKWLWCARLFKSRTLAAKFVNDGRVRVTRGGLALRPDKASFQVCAGDTLIYSRNDRLRIIQILAHAEKRGPASAAALLYKDESPPPEPKADKPPPAEQRDKGAGRPTKKDRRAIADLKDLS